MKSILDQFPRKVEEMEKAGSWRWNGVFLLFITHGNLVGSKAWLRLHGDIWRAGYPDLGKQFESVSLDEAFNWIYACWRRETKEPK